MADQITEITWRGRVVFEAPDGFRHSSRERVAEHIKRANRPAKPPREFSPADTRRRWAKQQDQQKKQQTTTKPPGNRGRTKGGEA